MKCKCGKEAKVFAKGDNMCWDCYDKGPGSVKTAGLHIDTPATLTTPRVPLCGQGLGDCIYHMTPSIAAAYMAQHPDQQGEFCGGCLVAMYRDYLPAIAEARLYTETLRLRALPDDDKGPDLEPGV